MGVCEWGGSAGLRGFGGRAGRGICLVRVVVHQPFHGERIYLHVQYQYFDTGYWEAGWPWYAVPSSVVIPVFIT
jgi:hypothetical protein